MSVHADRAYRYNKFFCSLCQSYYLVIFDKKRDKLFFMCADCLGCLDDPVVDAELQENTFAPESRFSDDYWNANVWEASLEQIRSAGLDLKHVFKRNKAGEGEYVEK